GFRRDAIARLDAKRRRMRERVRVVEVVRDEAVGLGLQVRTATACEHEDGDYHQAASCGSSHPHPRPHRFTSCCYGSFATIFMNSSTGNARSVSEVTLPCMLPPSAILTAVSSSGASETTTASYWPMT